MWRKVLVRRSIHFTEEVVTLANPKYALEGEDERRSKDEDVPKYVLEGEDERRSKDEDVSEQRGGDDHEACPHCGRCGSHSHASRAVELGAPVIGGTEEAGPARDLAVALSKSEYERFFHVRPMSMYAGVHRKYGLQFWVRDVIYVGVVCILCCIQYRPGDHTYRPVTNLGNRGDRVCERCLQGVPPNV